MSADLTALPLSFAQERLWFLDRLSPESADYNVPVVLRLRGRLDERSLQCALADVVERHEILRSRVAAVGGRAALVADPPRPLGIVLHDLTDDGLVEMADLFFLVLSRDDATHLRVLARLTRVLLQPGLLDMLRTIESGPESLAAILAAEAVLVG